VKRIRKKGPSKIKTKKWLRVKAASDMKARPNEMKKRANSKRSHSIRTPSKLSPKRSFQKMESQSPSCKVTLNKTRSHPSKATTGKKAAFKKSKAQLTLKMNLM
jgi:hypothetical protein